MEYNEQIEYIYTLVRRETKTQINNLDSYLGQFQPSQVLLLGILTAIIFNTSLALIDKVLTYIYQKGSLVQFVIDQFKGIPFVKYLINKKLEEGKEKLTEKTRSKIPKEIQQYSSLPKQGVSPQEIFEQLEKLKETDHMTITEQLESQCSGTVYLSGDELKSTLNIVYGTFSLTNPLHGSVFNSIRIMESEVIKMTASFLGYGENDSCKDICGSLTSGGTESILQAMKATRDYMYNKKGIEYPEMVIGESAHPAYLKAASYFKIKAKIVRVDQRTLRVTKGAVRRAITSNTIVVVASAPGYPHGVVDDVQDIAKLAQSYKICCHVDLCLGGFVLPFAKKLGYKIPDFDFRVPGVTSISIDTHKFGLAHKGNSVVLYRNRQIRKYQYTSITEWTGGLYISPGFSGSRSGAIIATAWASMVYHGEQGYCKQAHNLMRIATRFQTMIKLDVPQLQILGQPDMCLVAFKSKRSSLNIYQINDNLSKKGWHLSPIQKPPGLHMCFTPAHTLLTAEKLIQDLKESIAEVEVNPSIDATGNAPIYGMGSTSADRSIVSDVLTMFQDVILDA